LHEARVRLTIGISLLALAGCVADARDAHEQIASDAEQSPPLATPYVPPPMSPADSAQERARLEAAAASLRSAFERVTPLSPREVAELRLDVNATQIASARQLGTRVSSEAELERLLADARLLTLRDSTDHWILRRMEHSVPYATPDAEAMLTELGRRFHARLDAQGLPRYRVRVTSVLRTPSTQAALRRVNRNASWTVSAHEFGTTVDLSHERFAVPHTWWPDRAPRLPELEVELLEEIGREYSRALQAELGRTIWEMRGEGILHVMMEDAQPVYHITVARPLGGADLSANDGD
jgi:hypothetical protein